MEIQKRYVIRVYEEAYSFKNYDDSICIVPENEVNKEDILIEKYAENKEKTLKYWEELLHQYEGYTYCVKDVITEECFLYGVYDPGDICALQQTLPENLPDECDDEEGEYKDFYVMFKLVARYTTPVRARTLKEALELAESKFFDADFGEAEDIDGEAIKVENEEGDYIWEKEK